MSRTIVLTLPTFFEGEAELITSLLLDGAKGGQYPVDLVHIRKPQATIDEVRGLLEQLPSRLYSQLVLHDHPTLASAYGLRGIHLNSRHPQPPQGFTGTVSRSCHSLEEVVAWKERYDYVSLSPIFDSISKRGYLSAFTPSQIAEAHRVGVIDEKVMALGGVTFARLSEVSRMGFGGAMILGDAWI